jgi:hypothetical protein
MICEFDRRFVPTRARELAGECGVDAVPCVTVSAIGASTWTVCFSVRDRYDSAILALGLADAGMEPRTRKEAPGPFWVVQVDLTRNDLAGVRDDRNHRSPSSPGREIRAGEARVHRADLGDAIRAFFDHGGVTVARLNAEVDAVRLRVLGSASAVAALESYQHRPNDRN